MQSVDSQGGEFPIAALPRAPVARHGDTLYLLERFALCGRGISWIDVQLLASTLLAGRSRLWTRARRLAAVADELGIGSRPARR